MSVLDFVITPALAQAGAQQSGSILQALFPLILVIGIFYIFVIGPQRKRQKQHDAQVNALKRGAKIVTGGGFYATIEKTHDTKLEITLEGDGTKAVITRGSVVQILDASKSSDTKEAPEKEKKSAVKKIKK